MKNNFFLWFVAMVCATHLSAQAVKKDHDPAKVSVQRAIYFNFLNPGLTIELPLGNYTTCAVFGGATLINDYPSTRSSFPTLSPLAIVEIRYYELCRVRSNWRNKPMLCEMNNGPYVSLGYRSYYSNVSIVKNEHREESARLLHGTHALLGYQGNEMKRFHLNVMAGVLALSGETKNVSKSFAFGWDDPITLKPHLSMEIGLWINRRPTSMIYK